MPFEAIESREVPERYEYDYQAVAANLGNAVRIFPTTPVGHPVATSRRRELAVEQTFPPENAQVVEAPVVCEDRI